MKNRGKTIIKYLEQEIKSIDCWIKGHPTCNEKKLNKDLIILKQAVKILKKYIE